MNISPPCAVCHKLPTERPFPKCGKCHHISYCSVDCQKAAWKVHKATCPILASFKPVPKPDEVVCKLYDKNNRQILPLTQEEFQQRTGVRFVRSNFAALDLVERLSSQLVPESDEGDFSDKICLVEQDGMGYGVMAQEDIPKGAKICSYLGEIVLGDAKNWRSGLYRRSTGIERVAIDPSVSGNLAGFINDEPPNTDNSGGKGQEIIVRASRNIKNGEILYSDYGPGHAVKSGPYRVSENAFQTVVDFCKKKDLYTDFKQIEMVQYIATTFNVFVKLHLRRVLSAQTTLKQMEKRSLFSSLVTQSLFYNFYSDILKLIQKFENNPNALNKLERLGENLTSRAFCQVLLMVGRDISEQRIDALKSLGELNDRLYMWYNGALIGTRLDRPDEPEEEPFSLNELHEKFRALPPDLKLKFLETVRGYLHHAVNRLGRGNARAQIKALEKFAELLAPEEKS
ncbi:MAG: SET domain-containing protein-lysine N-methyltransferase [Parachlamydiales bacterium]|nr:SET domain-containing protein-lysine N-methyltransferase [Parachlamydiales bacterium]